MGGSVDPILDPSSTRLALFPIQHDDIWAAYRKHENSIWVASEMQLSDDWAHWQSLKPDEQHFVKHVLAFFAVSDSIVMENIAMNFQTEVQYPEAKHFYAIQGWQEAVHAESYSILVDFFVRDRAERDRLLNAVTTIPVIARKTEWAMRYMDAKLPFAIRLLAYACVEGISFSGSFCAVYWLKKRGLMPGLNYLNSKVAADEATHADFACLLYRDHLRQGKLGRNELEALVKGAVDVECEFVTDALPVSLIGMQASEMCEYVRFVADRLLVALGEDKLYGAHNPFDWMDQISLQGKTNFFEHFSVAEYALGRHKHDFDTDAEF